MLGITDLGTVIRQQVIRWYISLSRKLWRGLRIIEYEEWSQLFGTAREPINNKFKIFFGMEEITRPNGEMASGLLM